MPTHAAASLAWPRITRVDFQLELGVRARDESWPGTPYTRIVPDHSTTPGLTHMLPVCSFLTIFAHIGLNHVDPARPA